MLIFPGCIMTSPKPTALLCAQTLSDAFDVWSLAMNVSWKSNEEKGPLLFLVIYCTGLNYITQLCGDYSKAWNKDPYETARISWKVRRVGFEKNAGPPISTGVFLCYPAENPHLISKCDVFCIEKVKVRQEKVVV